MPDLMIRDLSEETHHALQRSAERHGRSLEAEIRLVLENAARRDWRGLGSEIAAMVDAVGGEELVIPLRTELPDHARLG